MQEIIKVQGVSKKFNEKLALDDINFTVDMGEIIGILGHNGAGKSTLINTMVDIYKPDSGKVEFVFDQKSLYDHIGVQMQNQYYEDKSKVIELCKLYKGLLNSDLDIDELLAQFNLSDEKNTYVKHLSGGNRQRLSILLTLIHQPEIIFLDELTAGLDPVARRMVWEVLKDINKKKNVTIILTSHFLDEIEYLADRIMILDKGKMVYMGGVSSLIDEYSKGEKIIEFQLKDEKSSFKLLDYEAKSLTDNRYQIRTADEEKVLIDLITNVGIKNLEIKSIGLEDVFLEIVGYKLDKEGEVLNV